MGEWHTGRMKHPVTAVGGWLLAVVLATGIGMLAVSLLRDGFAAEPEAVAPAPAGSAASSLPSTAMSSRPVAPSTAAAAPTSAPARPSSGASTAASAPPSPSASPSAPSPSPPVAAAPGTPARPTPVTRSVASAGGTAIARCTGASAYLVSWSPAPGYKVDDHERGPGSAASVIFEGVEDDDTEITLSVTCPAGVPVGTVTATAEE